MSERRPPLSWRNNNPGNIEYNRVNDWQGQIGPGEGGRFIRFRTRQHGWRALARLLMTYSERHQLRTVRKIIGRWAPPGENPTEGYVQRVARDLGVGPDDLIRVQDWQTMRALCWAIAMHEGGNWPWPEDELDEGLRMAGFDLPAEPATQTPEVRVGGAAAAAAAAGVALQELGPHLPMVGQFVRDYGPWGAAVLVALVAGWAALRLYGRRRALADA